MRIRRRVLESLLCLAFTAVLTVPGEARADGAPKYAYIDLGPVGRTSAGIAVNNAEQAVVNAGTANLWQDGKLRDLGTLCRGCYLAGSFGSGINGAGQVVGYTHVNRTDPPHAFMLRNGRMVDLGTGFGSGSYSAAWDINNNGWAVGERSRSQSGSTRAALWQGGTIRDLGTLGGSSNQPFATESIAYGVNDSGQIVGAALPRSGYPLHGFVWQNGVMRDLGTLGGNGEATIAQDIANTGQIVGSSRTASEETHAFAWTSGIMRDLGTLGGDYSGAFAVNELGQIVGGSRIPNAPAHNAGHAVLWRDGQVIDLNEQVTNLPPDVALEVARGINDDGVIVGTTCTLFCEPGKTAQTRAFLLVPVPGT